MAGTLTVKQAAMLLGRNCGPEFFFQQPWSALGNAIIPKAVNLNRPLERFHLVWQGRIVIATGNMTNVGAESLQGLIQLIKLTGTHQTYKAITPINLSGQIAFAWPSLFRPRGSSIYIGATGPGTFPGLVNNLGIPAGFGGVATPSATFGNTGTYDVEIHYDIPLVPVVPAAAKLAVVPFLYQQADWGDTLQMLLQFADQTTLGTPGTATFTFSSYGSGAGSPQVYLFTNYEILGALAASINSAVVIRNSQAIPPANIAAALSTLTRLQLLQKQKTTNILLKSGLIQAGTSAGVTAYNTLSDLIFQQTQVIADNKPIRNNFFNAAYKEYAGYSFDARLPQGYLPFSFMDSMTPLTAYPGDQLSGGSTFELDSQIATSNASNYAEIVQEQYLGVPGISSTASPSGSGAST
jgi:hypothetical protein